MLHKCNICGLLLPSSTFAILPATLSRPHHLRPSPYIQCRAGHVYVSRVVLCLSGVCDVWADVGEHVCVCVGLASDEAQRILQKHHCTLCSRPQITCLTGGLTFVMLCTQGWRALAICRLCRVLSGRLLCVSCALLQLPPPGLEPGSLG